MIRQAYLTDYPAIKDCAKAAFEPYVERIGKEPAPMQADVLSHIQNQKVYVLVHPDEVIGYVVFHRQTDHVLLENIAVQPSYTGQGYGRQLIEYVEQCASTWQVATIDLYTNAMMTRSIALYKHLGYEEIDHRYEDGFDRLFFRKNILPV